ncbi:hypothetical protein [Streptomyces clavuligerus]|uniref:hypothetical protein n=1 Tax=Streptomyces clavuligerus TaxID=1901 RepID=UPI001E31F2F4|nr:hypothetical protein [Streptomyces clavuligerus]
MEVTGLEQPGSKAPGSAATATVEVTTDGTGPVTLVLTWYTGEAPGELGQADGVETLTRSGARTYTLTLTHVFERDGCYLSALVSANPAPVGGDASRQILDRRCASSDESQPPA